MVDVYVFRGRDAGDSVSVPQNNQNYKTWVQAKSKIYNWELAFRSDTPVVNSNACTQVFSFAKFRSKVPGIPRISSRESRIHPSVSRRFLCSSRQTAVSSAADTEKEALPAGHASHLIFPSVILYGSYYFFIPGPFPYRSGPSLTHSRLLPLSLPSAEIRNCKSGKTAGKEGWDAGGP